MTANVREGGCLCGAVRYRAHGKPSRAVVCYCVFCQRCTDESGRWIRLNFCPQCGTTVTSTFEKGPGEVAILGGTFDDTSWITLDRQVWTRSKQHWVPLPAEVTSFEKSSSAS